MNPALKDFAKKHFPDSKSDLFAMFIERGFGWCKASGFNAQVTMQSWMFLSSFEVMREKLLGQKTISSLLQIGYNSFPEINSKIAQACAFCFLNTPIQNFTGRYVDLNSSQQASKDKNQIFLNKTANLIYDVYQGDFKKISGSPVAYWASVNTIDKFHKLKKLSDVAKPRTGLNTGNNDYFLKYWHELDFFKISFNIKSTADLIEKNAKWIPYNKGGDFRKWYGNNELVVNWENDGREIKDFAVERNNGKHWSRFVQNTDFFFKEGICWSFINFSRFAVRYKPIGYIFDVQGTSAFPEKENRNEVMAILCSKVGYHFLSCLNPTLSFQAGNVSLVPYKQLDNKDCIRTLVNDAVKISKNDWDTYETSWDFTENPLIRQKQPTLKAAFEQWQTQNRAAIVEMKRLEEENNRLFIDAYGLQDELTPDVPEEQITLVRADREKDCRDFISYAVGCLFGRYSLDKTGLILASQGETLDDYLKHIQKPILLPCENNVLPIIDGDWFADDVSERFREFLRVSFGEAHYAENLHFIGVSA
jgi:hypothetical protein